MKILWNGYFIIIEKAWPCLDAVTEVELHQLPLHETAHKMESTNSDAMELYTVIDIAIDVCHGWNINAKDTTVDVLRGKTRF